LDQYSDMEANLRPLTHWSATEASLDSLYGRLSLSEMTLSAESLEENQLVGNKAPGNGTSLNN